MTNEKKMNVGKEYFESPKAEVVMFHTEDVITASGGKEIDLPIIDFYEQDT